MGSTMQAEIVGSGLYNGVESAFVLDPGTRSLAVVAPEAVPEPDSLAAAAVALVILALVARLGKTKTSPITMTR